MTEALWFVRGAVAGAIMLAAIEVVLICGWIVLQRYGVSDANHA